MSRKPGSPKTGGRKKGTPNKDNQVPKEIFAKLCPEYLESDQFKSDWNQLSPKDRVQCILKMSEWLVPKPQSVDMNINNVSGFSLSEEIMRQADLNE